MNLSRSYPGILFSNIIHKMKGTVNGVFKIQCRPTKKALHLYAA